MQRLLAAMTVLALTATAVWAGKPKVGILGLHTGDKAIAPLARTITDGMRTRVRAGTGPYTLGPGTEKELGDVKASHNCAGEQPVCMAAIGADLGVDFLVYGHVSRTDRGYLVTMSLLEVKAKRAM